VTEGDFEKLPIDDQLSKLRDSLWAMVDRIKEKDAIDPNDIIGSVKDGISRASDKLFMKYMEEFMSVLDRIESKEWRIDAYSSLHNVLFGCTIASAIRGEEYFGDLKRLEKTIKTNPRREARANVKNMRRRHEKMRPFITAVDEKYSHLPSFNERAAEMEKELMANPEFAGLVRDVKDPRYPRKDIVAILQAIDQERELAENVSGLENRGAVALRC
jgi:hypothetical protein